MKCESVQQICRGLWKRGGLRCLLQSRLGLLPCMTVSGALGLLSPSLDRLELVRCPRWPDGPCFEASGAGVLVDAGMLWENVFRGCHRCSRAGQTAPLDERIDCCTEGLSSVFCTCRRAR